ncbi:hypothetical protein SAMN02745116_02025 [Pilibacter termitis]|uniref:Uncharacterized protein n=1 Tax=Pilibacter termitis TaxID=263852 RepID=A0A1T4Q276_9ENTE|nr:hypothetical protein [Pilibacter termitis]SJZ97736.1 hypothetical protein SAMN02745116_02025 [Pilibacter termitis]
MNLYVQLDTTNHLVTTSGISLQDFSRGLTQLPQNILLLAGEDVPFTEYDRHTGFYFVKGVENVANYFSQYEKSKEEKELRWIDVANVEMLKEISEIELSELLYLGHTKHSLHSPFFYKLKNQYVYFENAREIGQIYYRHLDEFYRIFARKITQMVFQQLNSKRNFFHKKQLVQTIPHDLVEELSNLFTEGVLFSLHQEGESEEEYKIPIFLLEDKIKYIENFEQNKQDFLAMLVYNIATQTWRIENDWSKIK